MFLARLLVGVKHAWMRFAIGVLDNELSRFFREWIAHGHIRFLAFRDSSDTAQGFACGPSFELELVESLPQQHKMSDGL
jgi:hypothetical protein